MQSISAERSVVTSFADVNRQRLDVQLRQLEFNSRLHRKLDLDRLLECFLAEGQMFVQFDGIQYYAAERGINRLVGEVQVHRQCFELRLGETRLGDITLMRSTPFDARAEREVERLVESLVYPLENALEHFCALQRATTDKATGLRNQLALDREIPREIRLARRTGEPLAIMLMSVDYLEDISENHGVDMGTHAWQSVAEALASQLRQSDLVFRTDNDEFLAVLHQTDLPGAQALVSRMQKLIDRCVRLDNVQFVLTASAAVTDLGEHDDAQSLLARVEDALHRASNGERNQVLAIKSESPSGDGNDPGAA